MSDDTTSLSSVLDDASRTILQSFSEELPPEKVPPKKTPFEKREVVSSVAYLMGIDDKYFGLDFSREVYDTLEKEKEARIVRNLSALRTVLERNYDAINIEMYSDVKNLHSLPHLVPQQLLTSLGDDGIRIVQANHRPEDYIVDIHRLLTLHINNCKKLFPEWIEWDYIRSLFLIPGGDTPAGNKVAVKRYYAQKSLFPYQAYINWSPRSDDGNILLNDNKFLALLYERNGDQFTDISKVTHAGDVALKDLGTFFKTAKRTLVAVDCENADPCKVIGVLREIQRIGLIDRICKILLVDDKNTSSQWEALRRNEKLPIEYYMTHRIKSDKSAVDVALSIKFCHEVYNSKQKVDSAVIISSDCDFWPLIEIIPNIRFLVMLEYENCGQDYYRQLQAGNIPFYYIDEFYITGSNELKNEVILDAVVKDVEEHCLPQVDMEKIVKKALAVTGIRMSNAEVSQFYERYIMAMRITFTKEGHAVLENNA